MRIHPYGEGDDNSSLMDDFDEWKLKLWPELEAKFPLRKIEEKKQQAKSGNKNFEIEYTNE